MPGSKRRPSGSSPDLGAFFMELEPATPPQKAADLAYSLLMDSLERDMDYEEFTFELEGGPDDGVEYKVLVMKV